MGLLLKSAQWNWNFSLKAPSGPGLAKYFVSSGFMATKICTNENSPSNTPSAAYLRI